MAVNLRGIRESGTAFAVPTYLFVVSVFVMVVTGLVRVLATLHEDSSKSERRELIERVLSGLRGI